MLLFSLTYKPRFLAGFLAFYVYNNFMKIFNGTLEAKTLDSRITYLVQNKGSVGELAVIQIGDNPSSAKYISIKNKIADKVGIKLRVYKFSAILSLKDLQTKITEIANQQTTTGCIIQLPLPDKNLNTLLNLIPIKKDIDCLSSAAQKRFYIDCDFSFFPPVIRAVQHFIDYAKVDLSSSSTVYVVGMGFLVGRPLAHYFKHMYKCNVVTTDAYEKDTFISADLLILSAGVPGLVKSSNIAKNCNVIDFGSSVINEKIVGDLQISTVHKHLGYVSPSPGGMGPLVVRYLLLNHLQI